MPKIDLFIHFFSIDKHAKGRASIHAHAFKRNFALIVMLQSFCFVNMNPIRSSLMSSSHAVYVVEYFILTILVIF